MSKYISLTAIGKDKPGIVAAVTKVLYELNCNIEDSTMTILHGQFAMILIINPPKDISCKMLQSKLAKSAKALKLSIAYSELPSTPVKKQKKQNEYIVSVYGADKPGIVYGVSGFLAQKKINIVDVQTMVSNKNYIMIIEAVFPSSLLAAKLKKEIAELAKMLGVTISVNQAESSDI